MNTSSQKHKCMHVVWGEELSKLLRQTKIVLNLHYHEAKILETCRILEAVSYGALVGCSAECLQIQNWICRACTAGQRWPNMFQESCWGCPMSSLPSMSCDPSGGIPPSKPTSPGLCSKRLTALREGNDGNSLHLSLSLLHSAGDH